MALIHKAPIEDSLPWFTSVDKSASSASLEGGDIMAWTDPASDKQIELMVKLCHEKDLSSLPQAQREFLDPSDEDKLRANLQRMNKEQASEAISLMMSLPKFIIEAEVVTIPSSNTPVRALDQQGAAQEGMNTQLDFSYIPRAGYYFIVDPTDGGEKFYRVQHGKEGTRWEGYVFLHVQASDEFYPVKNKNHREAIFREIAKDPIQSMNQYGMRIGKCGVCGRTLTDRHSILRGIGPICAAKLGPTNEQTDLLKRLGLVKDGE